MGEILFIEDTSAPSFDGFENLDGLVQEADSTSRQDLSLCFVCMKWASGDPECRIGNACELQPECEQARSQGA